MSYYDEVYFKTSISDRYDKIYQKIGELATGKTLDIGCGTGQLAACIKNYRGFDFSAEAIKIANNPNCWRGNIYDKKNYRDYDTYVMVEVLEHLKFDKEALALIPKGKKAILTLPSFKDPAHLRTYQNFSRYKKLIKIIRHFRFNWTGKWEIGGNRTDNFILLAEVVRI